MNEYDLAALKAIRDYHKQHGQYPKFVEATAEYRAQMSLQVLVCLDAIGTVPLAALLGKTPCQPIETRQTNIPVVAVGTGDIIFRGMLVRNHDINREKAECATVEQFQRLGAKLARAGLILMEPKRHWGQQDYPPFLFYSQIEVFVFGEQGAFDRVMAEGYNQLPGD